MFKQYKIQNYRFRLVAFATLLSIIGIMVIGSAQKSVQDNQIVGLIGGLIVMVIVSLIDYGTILKFRRPIYLFAILLLASVFTSLGVTRNNATRWILIPGIKFQFQPSEFCKILLIIFFAAFFMRVREHLNTWKVLAAFLVLAGIPIILIVREPDLSTTIITGLIIITLLFVAGLSYKIILGIFAVGIPVGIVGLVLILREALPLKEYQYRRIFAWIDPEHYADDRYQQENSIMAIGSGQLWGKGLNNTSIDSIKNGDFISEPQTDFIFSIVGEELGFVGCMIVIILLLLIIFECILIAKNAKDMGGRLICCGVAALIGFQSFVNLCVATGLMPNTGLPLPFVSYGLTSLISLFIGLGMVLNVGLQARKYKTGDFES